MKDSINLHGEYKISIDGQETIVCNSVGSAVKDNILKQWLWNSGDNITAKYFVFGTGDSPTDDGLSDQFFQKEITSRAMGDNQLSALCQLSIAEGNGQITEIGITTEDGTMLSYATCNFSKNTNIKMNIAYMLTIN